MRKKIIELASEPPAKNIQIHCSGTDESFQPDFSPTGLIGHVIEHRTGNLAAREAINKGHKNVVVRGESIGYPRGAEIRVEISSDKGSGFNLRSHLLHAIDEVKSLFEV